MRPSPLAARLALTAGLTTAALVTGYQVPYTHVVDVGSPGDETVVDGFHDRQRAGGRSFRWSTAESSIAFDGVEWGRDQELTLRMASGRRPTNAGPAEVLVRVNDRAVGRVIARPEPADYAFSVPRSALSPSGAVSIILDVPPFRAKDGRQVGVAVDRASLSRAGAPLGVAIPPLTAAAWILDGWVFLAFICRLSRSRMLAATLGVLALGVTAAAARESVSRFSWDAAVAAALAYALACEIPRWWAASRSGRAEPVRFLHTLGVEDPHRRRWVETAAMAAVTVHFLVAVVAPLRWWGPKDLAVYYHGGALFRAGGDYYDVAAMERRFGAENTDRTAIAFTSPPSAAALYAPLSLIGLEGATRAWRMLNLAFLVGAGLLVLQAFRPSTSAPPSPVVVALALSASEPVRITLRLGQVGILILLLLALSLWGVTRGRPVAAAIGIVLASAAKVIPAFLLVYPAYRRDRRTLVATAAVGGTLLASLLWVGGVTPWRTWFQRVLPALSAPVAYFGNQSVQGLLVRAAGGPPTEPPAFNRSYAHDEEQGAASRTIRLGGYAVGFAALGLSLWVFGRPAGRDALRTQLEFATMVPLMLLAAPLVWEFYLAWLLVPLLVAAAWLGSRPLRAGTQAAAAALLAAAWILLQYDTTDTYHRPGWPVALMSLGLYANVLVLACGLLLLGRRGRA